MLCALLLFTEVPVGVCITFILTRWKNFLGLFLILLFYVEHGVVSDLVR